MSKLALRVLQAGEDGDCVCFTPPKGTASVWLDILKKWRYVYLKSEDLTAAFGGIDTADAAELVATLDEKYIARVGAGPAHECGGTIYLFLTHRLKEDVLTGELVTGSQLLAEDEKSVIVQIHVKHPQNLDWKKLGYDSAANFIHVHASQHTYGCRQLLSYHQYGKTAIFTGTK